MGKTYWHAPFVAGIQIDLRNLADCLSYRGEYELSKEALKIDLVITKSTDAPLNHDIAQIFRGHNIFEYKSEKDSFSVWNYSKVMGYAFLYSSMNKIPLTDISVSIVLTKFPKKFARHLYENWGIKIEHKGDGIYHVPGEKFPVQIIESKKLSRENLFLRNLKSTLTKNEAEAMGLMFNKLDIERKNIYVDRVTQANRLIFKEVMKVDTFMDLAMEVAEEQGWFEKRDRELAKEWDKQKNENLVKKMLSNGFTMEQIMQVTDLSAETIKGLE